MAAIPPSTAIAAGGRPAEIREAALTLFAARGYHGTSMKDIADALGIRAPSLYNHVASKQAILADVMAGTMERLFAEHTDAVGSTADPVEQLRRATEAHVRYHARFPREVAIGNTELRALEEPERGRIAGLRREYAAAWEALLARGVAAGVFVVPAPRLTAYAILDMGIGLSRWYRADGDLSEAVVAYHYADLALRMAGVRADGAAFPIARRG